MGGAVGGNQPVRGGEGGRAQGPPHRAALGRGGCCACTTMQLLVGCPPPQPPFATVGHPATSCPPLPPPLSRAAPAGRRPSTCSSPASGAACGWQVCEDCGWQVCEGCGWQVCAGCGWLVQSVGAAREHVGREGARSVGDRPVRGLRGLSCPADSGRRPMARLLAQLIRCCRCCCRSPPHPGRWVLQRRHRRAPRPAHVVPQALRWVGGWVGGWVTS